MSISSTTRTLVAMPAVAALALASLITATLVARSEPAEGQAQASQQIRSQQQGQPPQASAPRGDVPRPLTAADYARAERFLGPAVASLVIGGAGDGQLAARRALLVPQPGGGRVRVRPGDAGHEDASAGLRPREAGRRAVDGRRGHVHRARPAVPGHRHLSPTGRSVSFDLNARRWTCDVKGARCTDAGAATAPACGYGATGRVVGRGGAAPRRPSLRRTARRAAFIRNWNLWVRDTATGQERQLTTDGVKYFGYATDNAGWSSSDRAIVLWSPDSKKIATFQQDEREVGEMYLVEHARRSGRPTPRFASRSSRCPATRWWRCCTASSSTRTRGRVVRFQMPPDFHRATLGDNVEPARLAVEPGRHARSRSSRPRATTRRRCSAWPTPPPATVRDRDGREGRHAVPVAGRLPGAVGHERGHLVLGARQLGPPLSLRPRDRRR